MDFTHRYVAGQKMSLNHRQSGIEEALVELECRPYQVPDEESLERSMGEKRLA